MVVRGNGNVGIGTTGPAAVLDIRGTDTQAIHWWTTDGGGIAGKLRRDTSLGVLELFDSDGATSGVLLLPRAGNSSYILSNVGIGTTSPDAILSVSGDLSFHTTDTTRLIRRNTSDGSDNGQITINGGGGGGESRGGRITVQGNESPGTGRVNIVPGTGAYFVVHNSISSFQAFNVDGTTGNATFTGSGGTCTITGAGACSSDIRLKKNVASLSYGLEEILALNPISYQPKNPEKDQKIQLGFIAQEVQLVLPEIVYNIPDINDEVEGADEFLGIAYERLVPVLVGAIHDLANQTASLSFRIEQLEQQSLGGEFAGAGESVDLNYILSVVRNLLEDGSLAVVKAVRGVFDELEAKLVKTERLEVQKSITIYDSITGQPVCITSENNILKSTPGECVETTPTPEPTPESTPEPTETLETSPTPEATPEATPEPTPETTPTPEPSPESTPEPTPEPELTPEP